MKYPVNNASTEKVTSPHNFAENGIFPWSWQTWSETYAGDGVRLFIDGFAAPADLRNGADDTLTSSRGAAIVGLYRKQGADFVKSLRGSFAVVLWDEGQNKLVLGTDHFGTRPIYYWHANNRIAFAPRIGAFAKDREISKIIEPNSVYFYLNHSFIPAPFTIYKNIRRLEPGYILEWTDHHASVRRYWDMTYQEDERLSEADAAELVRSSLQDSVRFSLEGGQRAVGAFLSGGTDSSTVVGLMSQMSSHPVNSFSVGFAEEAYNEIGYARIAAKHFKSNAHEYFVMPDEALDAIPILAATYDEPFGNSSAIPTYFCLKMARDTGVDVMFSGDGGDEIFGGNERYITEKVFSIYQHVPRPLRGVLNYSAETIPAFYPWRKVKNYIRKANQSAVDRFFAYQLYYRDHAAEFLSDDLRNSLDMDFPIDVAREHYRRAGDVSPLNRLLYVDLKLAVADNDLFKVNRMADVLGLQVRYPFLDPVVGMTSGKIPAGMKIKGWSKRYIFKKAFEKFLPDEILQKKKHGFGLPTGNWLRNHPGFRDLARSLLLDARSLQRGYFKRPALEGLLAAHDNEPSGYFGSHIWNFMMLELWHRSHAQQPKTEGS
jgi:asparagine synthase (glutamine-hydrolysing)